MNKGNLNKLVTNYPVELTEEEIANLSGTLAPVIAACGGGGGGTGGKIYTGVGFVTVNNTTNQIGLTNEANTKLNQDIPTKVSDLSDSANYQTVAGMDQYLTEGEAQATYLTKSSADTLYAPLSTTADIDVLKANSGDFSQYYTKNETYSKNEVYTKEEVYQKTETSSKNELANAFLGIVTNSELENAIGDVNQRIYDLADTVGGKQDILTFGKDGTGAISSINSTALAGQGGTTYSAGQYINIDSNDTISVTGVLALDEYAQYEPVLIGDSNITATSSKVDSHTQWNLRINATPVTTDTTLKGENVVTAHTTNVSGEWAVGLVQSAYEAIDSVGGIATDVGTLKTASAGWNKVSDKLDTTAFSTVSGKFLTAHQSLEDYATKSDINGMATQSWVGEQGFYTKASGDNDYAPKSVTATVNTLTGASAGWNEVTAKLDASVASTTYQTKADMNDYLTKSEASTTYQPTGNYLVADDITGKLDKSIYANASGNWEASYNVLTSYSAAGTWLTAHQNLDNYYTKTQVDSTFASSTQLNNYLTTAQYQTDSAKYVTSSNVTTQGTDYVMTTTGWKVLTLPGGGMTQVIHDDTLTGQGNDANSKLGVVWSALSGNTIYSAKSAGSATNAYKAASASAAKRLQDSTEGPIIQVSSITALQNWASSNSSTWDGVSAKLGTTQYANDSATFVTSANSSISADGEQYALTTTGWSKVSTPTIPDITATNGISANDFSIGLTQTAYNAVTSVSSKVDKPTSLNDKYLVLRTDNAGNVSGWEDLKNECYSKTEATGTFVATANIDTTTLSGDGKTVSTKLGVKTDVIATIDYVSGNYLPTSGGTVTGQLEVSGGSTFDQQFLKITRENVNGYGRIGLGQYGALALKTDDSNSHTTQVNISPNASNDQLVQVQHNGGTVGYLIPAVTSTTTAGLTNDGILHIILES